MRFMDEHGTLVHAVEVFVIVVCILVCSIFVYGIASYEADGAILMGMSTDVFGTIICGILFTALYLSKHPQMDEDWFMLLVVLSAVLMSADVLTWFIDGQEQFRLLNESLRYVKNLILLAFSILFWVYFMDKFRSDSALRPLLSRIVTVISVIAVVMLAVNLVNGWMFTIDAGGHYARGDLVLLFYILVLAIIGVCMCGMLFSDSAPREKFASVIYFLIWASFTVIQFIHLGFSLVFAAPALVIMIVYINFYTTRCEELAQEQARMREENYNLMMSQIQPHFLYNVLSSILMIKGNPPETQDALFEFGAVLRNNLETLDSGEPIPFDQELERTESYLYLEKLRFKDRLNVEMDILDSRFSVPPMTLQAIVENSVRHGITKRREGGTVWITVTKEEGCHLIRVTDNGLGFEMDKAPSDGKPHVGITMVRKRLETFVDGTMDVDSAPGLGTTVLMTIPDADASRSEI